MDEKKAAPSGKLESNEEIIARLEKENLELKSKLVTAEDTIESKEAQETAQLMFGSAVQEISCGTKKRAKKNDKGENVTRRVKKLDGDGKPELDDDEKEMWVKETIYIDVPVYKYKIDLPPSGGLGIRINNMDYFHGEVYEFDIDELRTVKDMIARSWGHEASIMGFANENAYRKPKAETRSMRGYR